MKKLFLAFSCLAAIKSDGQKYDTINMTYCDKHPIYISSVVTCKTDTVPCIMMVSDTTLRGNISVYYIRGFMTVQIGFCFSYNYDNYTSRYFDRQRLPLKLFVWVAKQIK